VSGAHTPGPWIGTINSHMVPEVKAGPITIATIWLPPVGDAFANQALIAAAPDAVAILQTIDQLLRGGVPASMMLDENSPTRDAISDVLARIAPKKAGAT